MKKIVYTKTRQLLSDAITPVSAYLRLRDRYANALLLESSDYHGDENAVSYICCAPLATFVYEKGQASMTIEGREEHLASNSPIALLKDFRAQFSWDNTNHQKNIQTGLFGYMAYDAVRYMENVELPNAAKESLPYPEMVYMLYRHVIAFDHFRNICYLTEASFVPDAVSDQEDIVRLLFKQSVPHYPFSRTSETTSDFSDDTFLEAIRQGIRHCQWGDVFQVVLSRTFQTNFRGDEFQVYRALRSINPSPYLFYFDYGHFKLFGSSPEAQLVIAKGKASIFPIAGTFKRTGNDEADASLAKMLMDDPKENAEHIMLVDLARNDLSRHCQQVQVTTFREIQYYSHVIHLVSKVVGTLHNPSAELETVAATFPAGTLSGAPKIKAMQIIDTLEHSRRGFYGGAIGYMGFGDGFNHAIMIRTFLSHQNTLYFRAGAGVVAKSQPESELQEVYNKLSALEKAMETAEQFNQMI